MGKAILVGSHSLFISGSFSASLFSIAYFKALLTSSNDSVSIIHIGATFWIFFIALYYLFEPVFEYFVFVRSYQLLFFFFHFCLYFYIHCSDFLIYVISLCVILGFSFILLLPPFLYQSLQLSIVPYPNITCSHIFLWSSLSLIHSFCTFRQLSVWLNQFP